MKKVELIRNHPVYNEELAAIVEDEKDRKFCGHDMNHLLDVARITSILALDSDREIPRELIYAAALLHDIGRHQQYSKGIPHDEAGAEIAETIMADSGFDRDDINMVTEAIRKHRNQEEDGNVLGKLLYTADKKSRACFCCSMQNECKWPKEKMNLTIGI